MFLSVACNGVGLRSRYTKTLCVGKLLPARLAHREETRRCPFTELSDGDIPSVVPQTSSRAMVWMWEQRAQCESCKRFYRGRLAYVRDFRATNCMWLQKGNEHKCWCSHCLMTKDCWCWNTNVKRRLAVDHGCIVSLSSKLVFEAI